MEIEEMELFLSPLMRTISRTDTLRINLLIESIIHKKKTLDGFYQSFNIDKMKKTKLKLELCVLFNLYFNERVWWVFFDSHIKWLVERMIFSHQKMGWTGRIEFLNRTEFLAQREFLHRWRVKFGVLQFWAFFSTHGGWPKNQISMGGSLSLPPSPRCKNLNLPYLRLIWNSGGWSLVFGFEWWRHVIEVQIHTSITSCLDPPYL